MNSLSLIPILRQELKLTPQMMQSIEILQMNSHELLSYLNKAYEENPVIEKEEPFDLLEEYAQLRQKASWIDAGHIRPTFAHDFPDTQEQGSYDYETDSLAFFLKDQLERLFLPEHQMALTKYLADLVDENGYLTEEDIEGLRAMKIPDEMINQALQTLQGLEPAGVGARDLSECLCLQLQRQTPVNQTALRIAQAFLPELSQGHYGVICRELSIHINEVERAVQVIKTLTPYPGQAFASRETAVYVQPDVFVIEDEGVLRVILNEYYLPKISISSYYIRLMKEADDEETKQYLKQKIKQAKWLLSGLDQRGNTLRRCAEAILEFQYDFFADRSKHLRPMSLSDLAARLSMHSSTISRAVSGKYLQCRQGTFPLRYFFSRAVGNLSRQAVKLQLLELICNENPCEPLSDRQLCALLSTKNISVARRTVAKYRAELGIASSSLRKHRWREKTLSDNSL